MKAVILAGGKGTRLAPYTTVLPKPLMPVGDMPILGLLLKQLRRHGIEEVVLAIGHLGALIRAVIGDGSEYGLNVAYSGETMPLGTAGPLHNIIGELRGDFLMMNGDLLTTLDFGHLIAHHRDSSSDATIGTYRRDIKIDFGLIERDERGGFTAYIEKPTYTHYVSMGVYVLDADAVREFVREPKFLDMPDLIQKLHGAGYRVNCFDEECFWLDAGRPEDYRLANEMFDRAPEKFLTTR
jgi:NDP-sugar pyrophosphorylase family protein